MSAARNSKFVWADALAASKLKPYSTQYIGLVMSARDNGDGKGFFISYETLSAKTGMDQSGVGKAVRRLVKAGWLTVTRPGGRGAAGNWATEYRLTIPDGFGVDGGTYAHPVDRNTGYLLTPCITDTCLPRKPVTVSPFAPHRARTDGELAVKSVEEDVPLDRPDIVTLPDRPVPAGLAAAKARAGHEAMVGDNGEVGEPKAGEYVRARRSR